MNPLIENSYFKVETKLKLSLGIPMGTDLAPIWASLLYIKIHIKIRMFLSYLNIFAEDYW